MKYRMLSDEELSHLETDLKAFLIVNGVHSDEWAALNRDNPEKARELIGLFSDTVLQIVYEKLQFLEFRSTDSCMVFHCTPAQIELIALNKKPGTAADLSTPESIHHALTKQLDDLTFFRSAKPYASERELEIHQLLEQGCVVSSEDFWQSLQQL